jgi:hemerythrin superfamily protein
MDALKLLKQDHETVKGLFEQASEISDEKEQKRIFRQISSDLEMHAEIEETIFYPAMEKHAKLKDKVRESRKEHDEIKSQLRELAGLEDSEEFESKFQELEEIVSHHAEEEEEGKMFPQVQEIVSKQDLEKLGQELEAAKGKRQRKAS